MILKKVHFFEVYPISVIWILGIIGMLAQLSTFAAGDIEYGDVGGKFTSGLVYLMYTPFILLFPKLYKVTIPLVASINRKIVWGYFIFITSFGKQQDRLPHQLFLYRIHFLVSLNILKNLQF